MDNFLMWLIGIVVSVIATCIVSKHYFSKSLHKSLTPFIHFQSAPLVGIDPEVRKNLQIRYKDKEIENLYEVQFLIANTGAKAVNNIIEPLCLAIAKDNKLLDANILFSSPEGRKIDREICHKDNTVKLIFPLLNRGEFFITKLLINGIPKTNDFSFTITADDLPPSLEIKRLPFEAISTKEEEGVKFDWQPFLAGIIFSLLAFSLFNVIASSWHLMPSLSKFGLKIIFSLGLKGWSIIISCVLASLLLLVGFILYADAFKIRKKRTKFIVPNEKLVYRNWYLNMPIVSELDNL